MEFTNESRRKLIKVKLSNRITPLLVNVSQKRSLHHRSSNSAIEKLSRPVKYQDLARLLQPPPTLQQRKLPPYSAPKTPLRQSPTHSKLPKPIPPSFSHKGISPVLQALILNKKQTFKQSTHRISIPKKVCRNVMGRESDYFAVKPRQKMAPIIHKKPQTAITWRPDSRYKNMFGGMENGRDNISEYKVPIVRMNLMYNKNQHLFLPECWN